MNKIVQKSVGTVGKIILVAALVFFFSWTLVKIAKLKSKPEVDPLEGRVEWADVLKSIEKSSVVLLAKEAKLNGGGKIKFEHFKGEDNIGWWDYDTQWISWSLPIPQAGNYKAVLFYSRPGDKKITTKLTIGKTTLTSSVSGTGGWDKWSQTDLGTLKLTDEKNQSCTLKVEDLPGKGAINFIRIELVPIKNK